MRGDVSVMLIVADRSETTTDAVCRTLTFTEPGIIGTAAESTTFAADVMTPTRVRVSDFAAAPSGDITPLRNVPSNDITRPVAATPPPVAMLKNRPTTAVAADAMLPFFPMAIALRATALVATVADVIFPIARTNAAAGVIAAEVVFAIATRAVLLLLAVPVFADEMFLGSVADDAIEPDTDCVYCVPPDEGFSGVASIHKFFAADTDHDMVTDAAPSRYDVPNWLSRETVPQPLEPLDV